MADEVRRQQCRAAALTRVAREGGSAISAPARAARLEQMLKEIDPDGTLAPAERERRLAAARKAHMAKMTAASIAARRKAAEDRRRALDAAEQARISALYPVEADHAAELVTVVLEALASTA